MSSALHVIVGSLGAAFALLILRADPRRHDNRAFAVLGLLDAAMALYRGIAGLYGVSITDRDVMLPCALLSPLLAWATIEFAWSFPFSRPLPWRWRCSLMVAIAIAITVIAGFRTTWYMTALNLTFFPSVTVATVVLLVRNLRRLEGDRFGVRLVIAAIAVRWLTANIVYGVYGVVSPELWGVLLWIESTLVVLVSFVMIGLGNIRSNLFTMRSAVGELVLESVFMLTGLVLTATAIAAALWLADRWPRVERPILMFAALVPLTVYVLVEQVRPRLEAGIDPRRARRREVLDAATGTESSDPAEVSAATIAALAQITEGGAPRFVPSAEVGGAAAAAPAPVEQRGVDSMSVLVRTGERVHGALVIDGGVLDRESLHAARLLADRLAAACEHRRLLGELDESRRLAELGAFAAAIAHDIRTPLTSVQMNVQILRGKVDLPADDMEHFDIALEELRRLDGHVRELLDYAKPVQLHRETVELKEIVDAAARTIEPVLGERGQALGRDHAAGLPPVSVDPQRLRLVLWNLLDNAAKASPDGARIEVRTRRDGGRVAIDVVDHGAGIAAPDLARIFEPFFTTRPDGTGLGLAICQKLVRGHGGELTVRSAPAQGSTFTVVLPAA